MTGDFLLGTLTGFCLAVLALKCFLAGIERRKPDNDHRAQQP